MELRSQRREKDSQEYQELKITLRGIGLYEEQMELREMQDIMQALQMSEACAVETGNNLPSFIHPNDNMLNSTMIDSHMRRQFSSPSSSPEPHYELYEVKAVVHHPMDWSPPHGDDLLNGVEEIKNSVRKRKSTEQSFTENTHETVKRLRYDSIENMDSGVNFSNSTSPSCSPKKSDLKEITNDDNLSMDSGNEHAGINAMKTEIKCFSSAETITETFEFKEINNNIEVVNFADLTESVFKNLEEVPKIGGYHDANESWD